MSKTKDKANVIPGGVYAATMPAGPLLLGADQAARLCGVSRRTWWSLHAAGKTPLPVRLGRRTLWRAAELDGWIAAGCPAREGARR